MSIATITQTRREFLRLVGVGTVGAAAPMSLLADDVRANTIRLSSDHITADALLPIDNTQHGIDVSPPLRWENLPAGTRELALIFEGAVTDQPRPFVHWVVYNIPAELPGLAAAMPMEARLHDQAFTQGLTGWKEPGYRGPYPRGESQTFRFRLYALDKKLNLPPGLDSQALLKAMRGHVLDTGELIVHAQQRGRRSG